VARPRPRRRGGQAVKVVVTGPFAAGKTTLIRTISEITVLSTERGITDSTRRRKAETTVAMDFGRITIDKDLALYLFGTPGQKRFDFMWEILSEGMLGFVVLTDSPRPGRFREARRILDTFRSYSNTPFIIAANKQDDEDAWPVEDLKIAMSLDESIRVLPCGSGD